MSLLGSVTLPPLILSHLPLSSFSIVVTICFFCFPILPVVALLAMLIRQEYSGKDFTGSNNKLMELLAVLQIQDPEEGDGLLRRVLRDQDAFSHFAMIHEGKIILNRSALQAWLRSYAKLQSLLLLQAQMLNTQTQPTCNLVVLGKHISLLCQYLKTMALTRKDKLIPHALDAITSDILVQDLALARPLSEVAANACFPEKPEVVDL
ncbi:hypothetical protein EDD15DRAFT_2200967 [Pisolithus albus]|nr:hypothetical protein EDD15DRAFT_2200963 [Pisolithus albus]KAI5984828.1 hypothetical protein EDD15DRAFT_2200967 [Pisolithus albus]